MRPGYAIEYDFVPPTQCKATLETRAVGWALSRRADQRDDGVRGSGRPRLLGRRQRRQRRSAGFAPFLPDRSEAYMAVMVDDLVTRGTLEPYRMFTSRAEYRLSLREDNADLRLAGHGYRLGLVSKERYESIETRRQQVEGEIERLAQYRVPPSADRQRHPGRAGHESHPRGHTSPPALASPRSWVTRISPGSCPSTRAGPIRWSRARSRSQSSTRAISPACEKTWRASGKPRSGRSRPTSTMPRMPGLSAEIKERLSAVRPRSLGQAARIPGVTPAAVSILMVWSHRQGLGNPQAP